MECGMWRKTSVGMKRTLIQGILASTSLLLAVVGCDLIRKPSEKEYVLAIQVAKNIAITNSSTACAVWRDFTNKWPTAKINFAFHYDVGDELYKGGFTASSIIEQRYIFSASFDFEMSQNLTNFECDNLRYHFFEVDSVTAIPGAGWSSKFTGSAREFRLKDWIKFTNANYDFHSLGLDLKTNSPVKNIAAPGNTWSTSTFIGPGI
jgi:hypothetical protein